MNRNIKQQQKLISLGEGIIVKTFRSVAKFTLVAGLFLATAGCTTYKPGQDYPAQGKVWRGDVTQQYYEYADLETLLANKAKGVPFDPKNFALWRGAKVRTFKEGFFKDLIVATVRVPDNVEFSDLGKGAIVDFILQKGTDLNWRVAKDNRILRLVCAGHDKECIQREQSANRLFTVIDPAPAGDFMNGNTYTRQVSPEEKALYH